MIDPYTEWDAAYVLGALDPDERRAYERHLDDCAACRRAVGELAGVAGLLAHDVRGEDPEEEADVEIVSVSALAERAVRRRRRTRALLGAAAALLVVAGGAVGLLASSWSAQEPSGERDGAPVALGPVDDSGVTAEMVVTPTGWGTRLDWSCSYPHGVDTADVAYELTVTDRGGASSVIAAWSGAEAGDADDLAAVTPLPVDDIERIELRVADDGIVLASADL